MIFKPMKKLLALLLLPIVLLSCSTTKEQKKILIYTKNGEGFVHDNIQASVDMLVDLASENDIAYLVSDDPSLFTDDQLADFDAVVFSNTNNEAFDNDGQREAFQRYIRSGGSFVGIHSACGSEREWPWFWAMLGGTFVRHPAFQPFTIKVIDGNHPSTSHIKGDWKWEDEAYYLDHLNPAIHVLLAHDLTTIKDPGMEEFPGKIFGDLFPGAWCQEFEGGKSWYTSYGHKIEHYSDDTFRRHVLGGILWAIN
jgi:type 1 glutamine amidotransferase